MAILQEYHRPASVAEALALLNVSHRVHLPLAGGTHLVGALETGRLTGVDALVDLARLGLDRVCSDNETLHLGAMVTLQQLMEHPEAGRLARQILARTLRYEGPVNLRNMATVGGAVALQEFDSEFITALLALDATVVVQDPAGVRGVPLQDFPGPAQGQLITGVSLSLAAADCGHARVARTPSDRAIVAAVAVVRGDTSRVALCGVHPRPTTARTGLQPPTDFKGSAAYRLAMADLMAERALNEARRTVES